MYEDENDLFDWVPDMDLDGDRDIYDLMLLEEDETEKKSGEWMDEEDDADTDDGDWEDEEADFEDDEFDFTPITPIRKQAKAEIVWADPLPNPAGTATVKSNAPAAQNKKEGFASLFAFAVLLYLFSVLACYILLTLFSALCLQPDPNADLGKTILIFSLIFSAIFVGWLSIPVSKKKDEWAFKAVNTVALTLAGVAFVFFIVFCRLD